MKYFSIIAFVLFSLACYGWGRVLIRRTSFSGKDVFPFLAVVGIACLIFLGGVLNLARFAYPVVLGMLLLSGLVFFVIHCSANTGMRLAAGCSGSLINPEKTAPAPGYVLPAGILIIAVCFYAWTLLPAAAFNHDDDFQTYIPRVLRMLQTGTMAGNPFDVLGIDIGAFAFLQGFVLLGLPIEYLLGLDAVFGFALAGWLLLAIGRKFNLHWSYTAFALLAFIVINPQSVNVSALYTGSAIILGMLFASCRLLDQMEESGSDSSAMISAGISGLLLAGLIALKTSFASYAFTYFFFFFTGLLLTSKNKRKVLKICGLIMLCAFVAILPWLALHAANYSAVLHSPAAGADSKLALHKGNIPGLFATTDLIYGGSFLSYGTIVLMLSVAGSYALYNTTGNRVAPFQRGYLLVAAASCAAGIISYFFTGFVAAPELAVRYTCPVLIATFPFALLAASMAASSKLHPAKIPALLGVKMALVLSMPLLIAILFWNNFMSRIERAYHWHMTLSYPISNASVERIRYATSPDTRQVIRGVQSQTLPAQKILVWISMPGNLDFSRNEIYSVRSVGLINPWIDMPLKGNVNDLVQYLKGLGVRYIMWEYKGVYTEGEINSYNRFLLYPYQDYREIGQRCLNLRSMLSSLMKEANFLYNVNGLVLFDLQQFK